MTFLGITARRIRASSFVDLVLAFINGTEFYYNMAFGADKHGSFQGGWKPQIPYPNETGHHVGDLSAAFFDKDEDISQGMISMWLEYNAGSCITLVSVRRSITDEEKVLRIRLNAIGVSNDIGVRVNNM